MRIIDCHQGSQEWLDLRKGRITMSHAADLLVGGQGKTRQSYLMKVAAERLATFPDDDFYSRDMLRGNELEPFARRAFEAANSNVVQSVGFVLHDDERIGCSPDGLTMFHGIEIKCPRPETHLKYLSKEYAEKEHGPQMQGCMWICNRGAWFFISFCPWVVDRPLIIHTIKRDEAMIAKLAESAIRGADEIDALVHSVLNMQDCEPVSAEVTAHATDARNHWENLFAGNDEVQL